MLMSPSKSTEYITSSVQAIGNNDKPDKKHEKQYYHSFFSKGSVY